MAKNIITTSEGNVRFEFPDTGKIINVHPNHIYTSFYIDTVSFMLIALPKSSGLAIMSSKAEDLEFDGQTYTFDQLPDVITEAFVEAGAQARWEVVDELPASGRSNTIYLVPKEEGSGFDEYIWLKDEQEWELIGDTDVELWRYLKKDDFNPYSAATKDYIDSVSGKVDTKFDASAITAYSTTVEVGNAIEAATSGKLDTSAFTAYSASVETELSGKQGTLTAGRGVDITSDVISLDFPISAGTGVDSLLMSGSGNTASGNYSVAFGKLNTVSGECGVIMGNRNTSNNFAEAAFGQKNVSRTGDASSFGHSGNTIFTVGNGIINVQEGIDANHNAFEIRGNGDIYIADTNGTGSYYEKPMIKLQDAIGGGSITIDPTLDSGSTNAVANSAITEAFENVETRLTEDEEVTAAGLNAVNDKFDGLKLKKITQAAYDALTVKDNNTLYIISD